MNSRFIIDMDKDTVTMVTTILGWIITIAIAIYTVKSSGKETAKKIAALEESTKKQVDSIKALSRQQIEATIKQVELEIEKNQLLANQAKQEWEGIERINKSPFANQVQWRNEELRKFQDKKPERDYNLYSKFIKDLETIKQGLLANKKNLG